MTVIEEIISECLKGIKIKGNRVMENGIGLNKIAKEQKNGVSKHSVSQTFIPTDSMNEEKRSSRQKNVHTVILESDETDMDDTDRISICRKSLAVLKEIYRVQPNVESMLQVAIRAVIEIIKAEYCNVFWFKKADVILKIHASRSSSSVLYSTHDIKKMDNHFVRIIRANESRRITSRCMEGTGEKKCQMKITAPIRIDDQIMGYVVAHRNHRMKSFVAREKNLLYELCEHISLAIEAQRSQGDLANPYIVLSRDGGSANKEKNIQLLEVACEKLSMNEKERMIKKIACRFVDDFYNAEFEVKHIVSLATEIIHNLNETLRNKSSGYTESC
jgi:hypothetical protein